MNIKKRSDCFFGLHNDFHAIPMDDLVVGETLREEDIREICETIQPEFIQVDCKGHPGWASYPTALGNAMPAFKDDPLMLWRKVTAEYGIGLYVHYSGVYDVKYCNEHPEQRILKASGKYGDSVRLDSKYWDEFFIPQITELITKYRIDGIWVDGECWSVKPDYHPETIQKFEKETGIDLKGNAPKTKEDPYFKEYIDYTREEFRKVLRYYVDQLHEKFPDFQICSNWAFSDHMPEAVCANVDFLSGDLNPYRSFNSARYAARMICQHELHWDLMAWNFRHCVYSSASSAPKHPLQVMQEAAAVIALGGGFQDYVMQFNDGSPNLTQIRNLASLSTFLKERKPYCFGGKPVPQAAVLVPTFDRYHEMTVPFSREGMEKYVGLVSLLCDSGVSTQTVLESTMAKHLHEYPLIIVPELYHGISEETFGQLKEYVTHGGNLCLIGSKTAKLFAERGFGFTAEYYNEQPDAVNHAYFDNGHKSETGGSDYLPYYFTTDNQAFGLTLGGCIIGTEQKNARILGTLHRAQRGEGVPFATLFPFEQGTISVIAIDLGTQYHTGAQYLHKELIRQSILRQFDPLVKIESAVGTLEIVCLRKNGRLMVQLVNANGDHNNTACLTEDQIPPVVDVVLSLKCDTEPKEIRLQPEGKPLPFDIRDGRALVTVSRVDIHSILEVIQ